MSLEGGFPENKVFKYLSIGLLALALLLLVREILLRPQTVSAPLKQNFSMEVKIDFDFLKSPALQELLGFPHLVLPETFGRENPFAAY